MNKENTKYLFDNFDFLKPGDSPRDSLMYFGFECGDGWFELIKKLCEDLKRLEIKINVQQVKEKFGGLRFYADISTEDKEKEAAADDLIREAESKSVTICELCGKNGSCRAINHWYSTRCDDCVGKRGWE